MSHDQQRRRRNQSQRKARRNSIHISEVIIVLRKLEEHRTEIGRYTTMLHEWLKTSDDFAEAWTAFSAAGGISAEDFHAFIHDQFPGRPVKQQKHLRLVASNDQHNEL